MVTPIIAATQDHLDIEDITDDTVLLKDGGACMVLQTTAVNFGLLSEKEQDAMIYAYAGLLNSLSFPLQIVIRSKRMDISYYLDRLLQQERKQPNEALRNQIHKYREFVGSLIHENNVLDKKFYVVIPFYSTELGIKSSSASLVGKKSLPYPKTYILEHAKNSLIPKRENIIKQFSRIGLKTKQLNTQELIELFYYIYNPQSSSIKLQSNTEKYTSPIVQPAIEEQMHRSQDQIKAPDDTPADKTTPSTNTQQPANGASVQVKQSFNQSLQQKLSANPTAEGAR